MNATVGVIGYIVYRCLVIRALERASIDAYIVEDTSPTVARNAITVREIPDPIDRSEWNTKKTKGDKHRDRAARRRKWGI